MSTVREARVRLMLSATEASVWGVDEKLHEVEV